ncbi:flagellar filament capping protein FliD [Hydrogenophaga defluvii]|uniref:Flagellar hook-associated protein 2 n=1 Tax=Hydrogenophaga defluvii TaxID=249410 RepID=A0ABW2SDM0_9BURK
MATISSPGIGSGLNIKDIVSQLVAIEKQPLTQLQVRAATVQTKISAYGELKAGVSALSDAAGKLRSLTTFNGVAATSSKATAISATAIGGTGANNFSVTVSALAKAQTYASASLAKVNGESQPIGAGTLSIQLGQYGAAPGYVFAPGSAAALEITVDADDTLADIASKINGESSDLAATVLNNGSGEQLLLRSKATGEAAGYQLSVTDTDGNLGDSLGLSRLMTNGTSSGSITQYAGDAKVMVNGSIEVTSATNTFKDIVSGVSVSLLDGALVGDVSEIAIKPDDAPIRSAVEGFVNAYNALNSMLAEATKYDAATKQGGLLQGDSFAIGIQNAMRGILQSTTTGSAFARLSDIGISQQLGGNLSVDSTKFNAAIAKPEDFKNLFRIDNTGTTTDGVAVKFKTFADGLLAASTGLFKTKEDSLKRALDQNTKDTERLNAKIARIEAQLNRRYSALDAQVAGLTALNNYVSQQVTTWNNANK